MHQNLLSNNNEAQSTTKYGFLLWPNAQIVALRAHCTRTALKAAPKAPKFVHIGRRRPQTKNRPYLRLRCSKRDFKGT